jgi:NAD(P)-dependent dehydrogenase (short-subunit alcohol dehydrogenase family)
MSLKDKHVVLIGASSGMGLATAKAAAEAGAKVTLVSRKPDPLERESYLYRAFQPGSQCQVPR